MESAPEGPASTINSSRICEGGFRVFEDTGEAHRIVGKKGVDIGVALVLVAGMAGQREVRDAVGTPLGFRGEMVDLQGDLLCVAVLALSSPFLEKILAYFVAEERAALVLDAGDLRGLEGLGVEANKFHGEGGDWAPSPKSVDPGERRLDAMAQAGRQPADRSRAVVKTRRAMPEVGGSAVSAEGAALGKPLADGDSAVSELGEPEGDSAGRSLAREGEAGGARTGVEFEHEGLCLATEAGREANRERGKAVNDGSAGVEQRPGPCRMAGHERVVMSVENENAGVTACALAISGGRWP